MINKFDKSLHVRYLNSVIEEKLDKSIIFFDTVRMTLVYFTLSSFDVLDSFDKMTGWSKEKMIKTIYSYQINDDTDESSKWGFRCSFSNGINNDYDNCHLALTYCALCSLIILGDDLKNVNRSKIIRNLSNYQKPNGCFISSISGESDMRFIYCAVAICYILNDFSSINQEKMLEYIMNSLTYEGAFGQNPGNEAHGGSTYCAIASLKLLGKLDDCLNEKAKQKLVRWCLMKQNSGFEGRPNKDSDTCYTFWIGATLSLLGQHHLINHSRLKSFCLRNQDLAYGGFGKLLDCESDIMHTYLGLSGLSLEDGSELKLNKIVPELNITEKSFKHLQKIISLY